MLQPANARRPSQSDRSGALPDLCERAFLDLPDALGADAELRPDVDEPLGPRVEAEAGADDLPLAVGEPGEERPELLARDVLDDLLVGVRGERVLEQVTERPDLPVVPFERLVEAAHAAVGGQERRRLVEIDARSLRELLDAGGAVLALVDVLVLGLQLRELAQGLRREPERADEVAARLLEAMPYPPGGVGRKGNAAARVVALERAQEADDSLLDEVGLVEALRAVPAGERADQRQQPVDQLLARSNVPRASAQDELRLLGIRRGSGFGAAGSLVGPRKDVPETIVAAPCDTLGDSASFSHRLIVPNRA